MRRVLSLLGVVAVFSGLALAETFHGKLIDVSCHNLDKSAACDPTATTSMFALNVGGKFYNLDDAGNAKAVEAIKNRADRAADPAKPASAAVNAKVTGTKEAGDILKVESIEVQ